MQRNNNERTRKVKRYYVLDTNTKKIVWYSDNKKECKVFIKAQINKTRYFIFKERWHRK